MENVEIELANDVHRNHGAEFLENRDYGGEGINYGNDLAQNQNKATFNVARHDAVADIMDSQHVSS